MEKHELEYPFQFYIRTIVQNLKKSVDTHLKPYNISGQQARILGFIYENQKQGRRFCQTDIEGVMGITGASVTSLLQGLEKKEFIRRTVGASDERTKELTLTPQGNELVDKFITIFNETEKRIFQGMTDEQKDLCLQLLRLISEKIKE